jgi:hypothetical protein
LGEEEFEEEFEGEFEGEMEGELESQATTPVTPQQATAEFMAAAASQASTEAEAEALIGAATITTLTPADRARLRRLLTHLVRGSAALTRILRRRRITRPAIRVVPTIVRATGTTLARRAAAGQPVTRRVAARVMSAQTRRALSNPRIIAPALRRNTRVTRVVARQPSRVVGRPLRRAV